MPDRLQQVIDIDGQIKGEWGVYRRCKRCCRRSCNCYSTLSLALFGRLLPNL